MPRPAATDLNELTPPQRGKGKGAYDWSKKDRSAKAGKVIAHFGDVAGALEAFLDASESVVGCVAWVTSNRMVDALAGKPVSLIVNKEFDLRTTDTKPDPSRTRQNLDRLSGGLKRSDFPAPLNQVAGAGHDEIEPVRCVGHIGRGRGANTPLMHHKFIVRLRAGKPVAVWTGSLNLTHLGQTNLENGVEIHDPAIARAYLEEWARVAAVSEPLDFTAGKAAPSWKTPQPRTAATAPRTVAKPAKRRAHGKPQLRSVPGEKKAAAARKPKPRTSRSGNRRAAA